MRWIEAAERFFERTVDSGSLLAIILGFGLITRLLWIYFTQEIAITGAMEESLLQLVSARNWLERGFMQTAFLPDYVTSAVNEHHPVVYTHFPPVSALIPAFLLKLGANLKEIRFFFSVINILGIFCFYKFLQAAFDKHTAIAGAFFSVLLYEQLFMWQDHFDYSFVFLAFFLPCWLLFEERPWVRFGGVAASVFFASILNYKIMFTQIAMIGVVALYISYRRLPMVIMVCVLSAGAGVLLHLMQNFAFLGYETGWQELVSTFQNRVFGVPSTADLQEWFRAHNIVLWGAPKELHTGDFLKPIVDPIKGQYAMMRGFFRWPVALMLVLAIRYSGEMIDRSKVLLLLGLVVVASAWGIVFPAHAQGYGIPATEAVGPLVFVAILYGFTFNLLPRLPRVLHSIFFVAILLIAAGAHKPFVERFYNGIMEEDRRSVYNNLSTLKKYQGAVVWSNITSVWIGYFMNQIVPGRCTIAAVKEKDQSQCMNVMVNSRINTSEFAKPKYFVFSDELLSGNMADATPEKLKEFRKMLLKDLTLVEENTLFSVFAFKEGAVK